MNYQRRIAEAGLEIKAIKLLPENPFTWASGFRMPIYNDNRMFLSNPKYRKLIANGIKDLAKSKEIEYEVVAGTSTAGIPPATTLADMEKMPLIYVRDKPKDHGLKNQIEGIDSESDLEGKIVLLIEDLVSTAGSSVKAVQGIRNAKGICNNCISIFNYGLDVAQDMFNGKEAYDKLGNKLNSPCNISSLLMYDFLLKIATDIGYIDKKQATILEEWREDPFGWGEKRGFPRVKK